MPNLTIKSNHPARKRIADLPNYFDSKGAALSAIDDILQEYGMELGWADFDGNEGWNTLSIRPNDAGLVYCDDCDRQVEVNDYNNIVAVSWYRMSSGRWEVVAYIS